MYGSMGLWAYWPVGPVAFRRVGIVQVHRQEAGRGVCANVNFFFTVQTSSNQHSFVVQRILALVSRS